MHVLTSRLTVSAISINRIFIVRHAQINTTRSRVSGRLRHAFFRLPFGLRLTTLSNQGKTILADCSTCLAVILAGN